MARYPSVRVYGPARSMSSFSGITRGALEGLRDLGQAEAFVQTDDDADERLCQPPGAEHDIGLMFGVPNLAEQMSLYARHRLRFCMIAPNSSRVPGHVLRWAKAGRAELLSPSAWGVKVLRDCTDEPVSLLPHGVPHAWSELPMRLPRAEGAPWRVLHVTSTAGDRKMSLASAVVFSRLREDRLLPDDAILTLQADHRSGALLGRMLEKEGVPFSQDGMDHGASTGIWLRTGRDVAWGDWPTFMRLHDLVLQPSRAEGFGLCLKRGTLITTPSGPVPVEAVGKGDTVLTRDGTWGKVLAVANRPEAKVRRIRANGVLDLCVTDEHPVLVVWRTQAKQRAFERAQPLAEWVKAGDILPRESYLVLRAPVAGPPPAPVALHEHVKRPQFRHDDDGVVRFQSAYSNHARAWLPASIPWTRSWCLLVGYFAAEGSTYNDRHGVMLSFDSADRDAVARAHVHASLRDIGLVGVEQRKAGTLGLNILCSNAALARWLSAACGNGAKNKRLPEGVWGLGRAERASLLEGLVRGDGCNEEGTLSFATVSPTLAFQVRDLWLSLGIPASIRTRRKPQLVPGTLTPVHDVDGKPLLSEDVSYLVRVSGRWLEAACALVGLTPRRSNLSKRVGSEFVQYGDTWLTPVTAVTEESTDDSGGVVYDLQVDKETMVANGVVVHNCPLEALALGVPVCATLCTGHADFLVEGDLRVTRVHHGPDLEIEDGDGATAPSVDWEDIQTALLSAFERRAEAERVAAVRGPTTAYAWSWARVLGTWFDDEVGPRIG
jgi:intein/homing endonuclease